MRTDGDIFRLFKTTQRPPLSDDTQRCAVATVQDLLDTPSDDTRPGMLLGKIQSGKTRAFVGIIGLALDNGFDLAIVFTKGTKALTKQTVRRLERDLAPAIAGDLVFVYDVKFFPDNLVPWELEKKLILVCKKEDDNLNLLWDRITNTYPELATRRTLIIDDEADFASVGYRKTRGLVVANVIPTQINGLRQRLPNSSYLQVTATPYALYLQPAGEVEPTNGRYLPVRPAFTQLVPVHDRYVGGDYYFDQSLDAGSVPSFLHVSIDRAELEVLKKPIPIALDALLTSPHVRGLRRALTSFVIGSWIRRQQQTAAGQTPQKYSFIVHTETNRQAHRWQTDVVNHLLTAMQEACGGDRTALDAVIGESYDDLSASLTAAGLTFPTLAEVSAAFCAQVSAVMPTTVNSERDIEEILDDSGQLRLRTPYNIFIGGQILDRGLTIDNLIGFYYGRRPKVGQQDTILQHSRMYGSRAPEDLAVTRFYTTQEIHDGMRMIHDFDEALRAAIAAGGQDAGVVFLREDTTGTVRPCAPNKTLMSTVISLRPGSRQYVPQWFTTKEPPDAAPIVAEIDRLLAEHFPPGEDSPDEAFIPVALAERVLDLIDQSLDYSEGQAWDVDSFKAAVKYLATENQDAATRGTVLCVVRRNRDLRRVRTGSGHRFQNAPDSLAERQIAERATQTAPSLLLYRNNGTTEALWKGTPFWWPVLRAPNRMEPVIFAAED